MGASINHYAASQGIYVSKIACIYSAKADRQANIAAGDYACAAQAVSTKSGSTICILLTFPLKNGVVPKAIDPVVQVYQEPASVCA
jgi:hypothetical protein